jgi:predicted dithiol-disulfide oxidoreductase (DUF899 family)
MPTPHEMHFPGETQDYRAARNALLDAEVALQRQVIAVAAMRSKLPLGGATKEYTFQEGPADLSDRGPAKSVKLAELFAPGQNTLLLYSYMFSPDMEQPCPMCTSFLDGLNGNAHSIRQRVSLAVAAQSPIERIRDFGRARHWVNLRLISSAGTTYARDYHGEDKDGGQVPMMNVFVKRGGNVHHYYSSEAAFVPAPDHEPCHLDLMWPLWNVLDLTPEGRGDDFYPDLSLEK